MTMKPWSKTVNKCRSCEGTDRRHMAKGLCVYCYLKQHHTDPKNVEKIKAQKNEHYLEKQKPKAKATREALHFDGMREAALQRDKNLCKRCGAPGDIVHHIDGNGRGSKNPNNSLDNLMTLCRACHAEEHRELLVETRFRPGRDGWARDFSVCTICGKADSAHNSRGRCSRCVAKIRRSKIKI